jgi:inhibitor of KinA sporulation pathway (predicted exonuclease)
MKHIVFDLETLSTRKNAVITSIGAVKVVDNKIVDEFKINIDPADAKSYGLHIDKKTVEWWAGQSKEARMSWMTDPVPLITALTALEEWYGTIKKKYHVWGYGANFDISILEANYHAIGKSEPWTYTNVMCLRTISTLVGVPIPRLEGTHHDALDDAKNQAKYLIDFYSKM